MKTKLALLAAVLSLQTAWILGTTYLQERTLAEGQCILLETRPVDPRDLIRGDYVILNYAISDLPLRLFSPPLSTPPPAGQLVYVALEPREEFYEAVAASTSKAEVEQHAGRVILQGRVQARWFNQSDPTVHVEYGLERFYVREGTGNPRGKLTAQVAVPVSGRGQLKQVFVDGQPYAEAMKESRK